MKKKLKTPNEKRDVKISSFIDWRKKAKRWSILRKMTKS